jgi:hypothetical protein
MPDLHRAADTLLREDGQPLLPKNAFVFLMHQGYHFMYFIADGQSDDPPVYYYLEGELRMVRKFDRFSDLGAILAEEQ